MGRYELGAISFRDFKNTIDHLSRLENEHVETWDELIVDYETHYQKLVINKDWSPNFKNLKWYNLNGKLNNFRDLVKSTGLDDAEYNIAYKLPSINVHGLEIVRNISVKRETGEVIYQGDATRFKSIKTLLVLTLKNLTSETAKYYKVDKTGLVRGQMKVIEISYKGIRI